MVQHAAFPLSRGEPSEQKATSERTAKDVLRTCWFSFEVGDAL